MERNMTRRNFMKATAISGMLTALQRDSLAAGEKPIQPDILLLMPDQMRGDCLSILDHPVVRTPQMDQLAKQGVLFRRGYTTVASCIPARYALLTGLYPQTSGVVGYKQKPFSMPPFPELLANAGYATILVGRNMHQPPASGDCGYQKRILGSTYIGNDAYDKFLKGNAPESGGITKVIHEQLKITYNGWRSEPWPYEREWHPTAWVASESRKVLEATPGDKPLFLTSSFYAPHSPLFPPKKELDYYFNHKSLPKVAKGDWVDYKSIPVAKRRDDDTHNIQLEGEILRNTQAGYYGLIEQIDTECGPLIRDFTARSKAAGRPWVIVVTSDHGDMLGDHGMYRKCEPFEGSANIPFIISGSPELGFKSGLRVNQPVCLEDIMPTLLALAGTRSPAHVDGVDLSLTLRGQKQMIREWLHFEHAPCYSQAQAYHALTDGRHKYIWRPLDGTDHLFDLENDPQEEHDLSLKDTHLDILATWRTRLIERLANRPEGFSKNGKLISGRPYHPLNEGMNNGTTAF